MKSKAGLKILMLNNEYPPLGGGTGTVNQEIIERIALYHPDIKIDLITGSPENKNNIERLSDNVRIIKLGLNNKNIHHASNPELIKYTFKAFFYAIKMQRKEKYNFSFAWSTIPAGFVSYLLKILYKLPYMVRVGGPDIPGFEERYKTIYKIISPLIRRIWKKSELIITKCQTEYDMIYAVNKKLPLKIIYNGVDTEKFYPKQHPNNKTIKLICPARLIRRKGQDILIKAIAKLKQKEIIIQVDLVGDGDEEKNYKQLAEETGVIEQIQFTSYIPREKMAACYHSADVFVLPSYNEGMSNSLLEAMACGLPVIVTDVGGTSELVEDGVNGFVFPVGDFNKLSDILSSIWNNPAIINHFGSKSLAKAKTLAWHKIVTEYEDLFRNCCNK